MSEDPFLQDARLAPDPASGTIFQRWREAMIGMGCGDMVDALPVSWSESITGIPVVLQEYLARGDGRSQVLMPDDPLRDLAAPLVNNCLTHGVSLVHMQAALFALKEVLLREADLAQSADRRNVERIFDRLSLAALRQWQEHHEEWLQKNVVTDSLTSLFHGRYLKDCLEREVARSRRYKHILSLALINVDGFKHVNDTHGRSSGDRVLQHLAQLMRQQFRQPDTLGRMDGDGFAVILTECLLPDAQRVCERFRKKVAESPMTLPDGQQLGITVSIGMAQFYPGIKTDELFKKADKALFRAKLEGKNRVYVNRD